MTRRPLAWLPILAAIVVGAGVALLARGPEIPTLESGTVLPEPRPIGAFGLVDQNGREFGRAALAGRWTLVFTGFTHCPDICPTTLAQLAALKRRLGSEGRGLRIVFLSVDPARDSPEALARYLGHFGGGLTGLTGAEAEVLRLERDLGLAHVRNPGAADDYTVDHSAALVLIDPEAQVAGYFRPPWSLERLAADLAPLAAAD